MPPTTIRYSTLPENSHSNSILDAYRANLAESSPPPVEPAPPIEPDSTAPALPRVTFTVSDPLGGPEPGADEPATRRPDRPRRDTAVPAPLPDSDPRSPRYEPPSLRHKPGDTYEIGGRPHDSLDPGPYGTPDWRQDPRTGRHRRGELPDPHPDFNPSPQPGSRADPPRDHPNRPPRRPLTGPPDPELTPPSAPDDSEAPTHPFRRYRRWDSPDTEPPHRFSPMREHAMRRFLELSQPFRDAHFAPEPPTVAQRAQWVLRWLLWVVACGLVPMPRPLTAAPEVRPAAHGQRFARSRMAETPRQTRPRASSGQVPYMVAWEQHFDARHALTAGGVA